MLSKALREYDTVSVEPSTDGRGAVLFEKGASRAGVDVRRFPWIRPLSGDYAYHFDRIASLYAGDPTRPEAWRDVIARVHGQKRNREAIASVLAAQQGRRNAPPEAREARGAAHRSQRRRDSDRAAGGSLRRPHVHAAEDRDGPPARPPRGRRAPHPCRAHLLGGRRGPRLGGDRRVYDPRLDVPPADDHARAARGRRRPPGRAPHTGRSDREGDREISPPPCLPPPSPNRS